MWKSYKEDVEVIVDFCAYERNDIAKVLQNLTVNVQQYILISTVDVYERGTNQVKNESTPFEKKIFSGDAGNYIAGKIALEQELVEECKKKHINYTVLRPAILYGPFNYAPRESVFIQMIVQNHILPRITDATVKFKFIYVKDAAEAIIKCLLNQDSYGQAYNLCQDQVLTYDLFLEELKNVADVEFQEIPFTLEEAEKQGIPIPFPATKAETELCSNEKSKNELNIRYTTFSEGMAKTYRAFKGVYS